MQSDVTNTACISL